MFVVVQSEFGLVFLEAAFNGPARPARSNQFLHRSVLGGVAQGVFDLVIGTVTQQQPALAFRSPFRAQVDPHPRKGRHQRALLSFRYFVSLPVQQRLGLEQFLDRAAFGFELLG